MMKKAVFLFAFLSLVFVSQTAAQTRSENVSADLNAVLLKYDVVKISPQNSFAQVGQTNRLSLTAGERSFDLKLTPRDLLAPNYRAAETSAEGLREIKERPQIRTFKGTVGGEFASKVRLTISENKIEGFIFTNENQFYIEPASHYSKSADADEFVFYEAADKISNIPISCDLDARVETAAQKYIPTFVEPETAFRVAEIASEADFEFFTANGSSVANANAEVLNILNMVEGKYEEELNITFAVTFQHVWTSADPFPGNSNGALATLKDYWNANFPVAQFPRDLTHLFSGKGSLFGQGLAYIGVVCTNPNFAYGLDGWVNSVPEKYLLTGHELGHGFGGNHADAPQGCGPSMMNSPPLSFLTPLAFCQYTRSEIGGFVNANGSCLTAQPLAKPRFDFDGDNKSDVAVFRPANGAWYVLRSASGAISATQFGANGDRPAPEDFDGDKQTDFAVFRPSNGVWYILRSSNNTFSATQFGTVGDIPAPADFSGDGKSEIGVFRPSSGAWFTLNLVNNGFSATQFGASTDVPVAGDYDNDGRADIAVYRTTNGAWYQLRSTDGFFAVQFGASGDKPVPADFDADGKFDAAVYRPASGVWYILQSGNGVINAVGFGISTDTPAPADFDGDGKADVNVFRAASGSWFRLNSSNGAFLAVQFGANGDVAIPAAFVP